MMRHIGHVTGVLLARIFLRPAGWLGSAICLLAVFVVLHLLGWRDDMSFLTGTVSPTRADLMILRGTMYGLSYLAAVIVSPILILAAVLRAILERLLARPEPPQA